MRNSRRASGTNPRALKTNPRALGVSPRDLGVNPTKLGVSPHQVAHLSKAELDLRKTQIRNALALLT